MSRARTISVPSSFATHTSGTFMSASFGSPFVLRLSVSRLHVTFVAPADGRNLGLRRPLTSFDLGVACLFRRLTLEPARWVPRIAAASACHRILILSRAPRAARLYPVSGKAGRLAMEVVHPQVAGIDVHKKVIWVAVRLPGQGPGQRALTV